MTIADDLARVDSGLIVGVPDDRPRHLAGAARQRGVVDPGATDAVSELTPCGWLVEVRLTIDEGPGFRFFAVGMPSREEAEEAILRFPGIFRDDTRKARRQLSAEEIVRLRLRAHAVRPYRRDRPV